VKIKKPLVHIKKRICANKKIEFAQIENKICAHEKQNLRKLKTEFAQKTEFVPQKHKLRK
jgi:hypothetical protein